MKKITVRKTETVRLTSVAQAMYGGDCGGGGGPIIIITNP